MYMHKNSPQRGITLLITLLLMSVLLGISASLLNVSIKQFQLSGIARDSEMAFQAANAGMECALYYDNPVAPGVSPFDVNGDGTPVPEEVNIACMGQVSEDLQTIGAGTVVSGEEQHFRYSWKNDASADTPTVCTDVSIFKFSEVPAFDGDAIGPDMSSVLGSAASAECAEGEGTVCTIVKSRGYNVACPIFPNPFPARTIERELTQRY